MAAIKKTQASSLLPTTIALVSITLILAQEKVNIKPTNNKNDGVICNDTPNWLDAFGNTCSYYATESTQICSSEGIAGDGGMGVATENCCVCGGGTTITANSVGMPTARTTNSAGDIIVNPGGTCGKGGGDRGNGICENGKCCSKVSSGYCRVKNAVLHRG